MPNAGAGQVAAQVGMSLFNRNQDKIAFEDARNAQNDQIQMGIDANTAARRELQEILRPYTEAGYKAIGAQGDLIGLGTQEQQQQAINAIQSSPQFQSLNKQGANSILQNASATGNLRGGNTQRALAQFGPDLLSKLIESQFNKLGLISSLGQNAAAGSGNAALQTAANNSNLYGAIGANNAGASLASRQSDINASGNIMQSFGGLQGMMGSGGSAQSSAGGGGGDMFGGMNSYAGSSGFASSSSASA